MSTLTKYAEDAERLSKTLPVKKETFRNIVTGEIYRAMKKKNISKSELARKMGKSRSALTHLLSGDRNFTLDKFYEICFNLGQEPIVELRDKNYHDIFLRFYRMRQNESQERISIWFNPENKIRKIEFFKSNREIDIDSITATWKREYGA
jgi:transcriptional regulator with XRE-family HTH domain